MEIHIKIVKHLLKCYFKHSFIILVAAKLWSGIGVKIKVTFHCTDLAFYAVLFEFNVASVTFSCCFAN